MLLHILFGLVLGVGLGFVGFCLLERTTETPKERWKRDGEGL